MGCTVREKLTRTNRRPRSSLKSDGDHDAATVNNNNNGNYTKSGINEMGNWEPMGYQICSNEFGLSHNPYFDDSGWGYCTEEQLEEILLKNLEILYNDAVSKLVALGYDEDVVLKAILRNGHCYGGMDVLTNILHNSLAYLNNGCSGNGLSLEDGGELVFVDLKQLEEFSLAGMVCLLQQVKPRLSKGDAMWCLLMSDLHVGRASVMEFPVPLQGGESVCVSSPAPPGNVEGVGVNHPVGVAPALCRFHGGWGFGTGGTSEFPMNGFFSCASEMTLQREIECPKRFNLTPSMKTLLKRNVAAFAAGFRANSKQVQTQARGCISSVPSGDLCTGTDTQVDFSVVKNMEQLNTKNQDVVNSVLSKFEDFNLNENNQYESEDHKDEMILGLIHQVKDLERQVKERKEWAHQKAMQAARKLSHDLTELKMLRMERDENERLKKSKQTLEDTAKKRLSEMESALRQASGQADLANGAVRRLEIESAEIRAEMEASKLSASEYMKTSLEIAKREKKRLKRLLAWEKQKTKLQEDIAAEKQNISKLQEQLVQVETAQKEAEARWRQAQNAKELASAQVEEERNLKEASEATHKRGHEALRLKIEIDFQRHKDDLQRLEQELSRLKVSAQTNEQSNLAVGNAEGTNPQGKTIASMLHELDNEESPEKGGCDRECLICMNDEVSVVFLPCAHQVLCSNCNDSYAEKGKALCPCCRVPIEQRIRVYGASSS